MGARRRKRKKETERGVTECTTELRQAKETIRQHEKELAHALRVSTAAEMARGLAHELNQPLTAIMNYAGACLEEAAQPDQALAANYVENLRGIIEQAERAAQILRRLRSLVREDELAVIAIGRAIEQVGPFAPISGYEEALEQLADQ